MLGLNIKLHSFEFYNNLVATNENIRVSITTLPDGQKQAFTFNTKKINSSTASFVIKFSESTEKIVIVFRKQSIFTNDSIFASTVILSNEIMKFNRYDDISVQKVNIYEPKQKMQNKDDENRKILGRMIAQFSLLEKFSRQDYNNCVSQSKNNNKNDSSRIDSILKKENMLFQDLLMN